MSMLFCAHNFCCCLTCSFVSFACDICNHFRPKDMVPKRICPEAKEINVKIKIKKYSENVDLSITNKDARTESSSALAKECNSPNSLMSYESVELMTSALIKNVLVGALEPIPVLQKKCARLGINVNLDCPQADYETVSPRSTGRYEIEQILDHDTVNYLYFVKWKGYGTEFNTWEPIDHLVDVAHLVQSFRLMERSVSEDNKIAYKKLTLLSCLLNELTSSANKDPYVLLKLNGKSASEYNRGDLFDLKSQLKVNGAFLRKILVEDKTFQANYCRVLQKAMIGLGVAVAFESVEKLDEAIAHRKKFFKRLKNWEANINRLILQDEGCTTIRIENNCDFDLPFEDFTYITKCIPGLDVYISREPLLFCDCNDCFANSSTCCPRVHGTSLIYNKDGHLKKKKLTTIFECNSKCKCQSTCPNRVIQNGQKFQLGIFKTANGRGWGVQALERIPNGQFIVEYVGEVITEREVERRTACGQNPFHKSYLFDLEYEIGTNGDYVLDGAKFGNISRFINHSCSPNLEVYPFWIENPDMKMPRIAFFSRKCIASGEELTFDYRMSAPVATYKDKCKSPVIRVPCKCGSKNCRKFLF